MLQPAAITTLLSQLIDENTGDTTSIRPHTALLTLLESSELYAVATTLAETTPSRSAVASILASTAAAAGTAPPPPSYAGHGRSAPLTLDERAACLSAIAVTSWRQATEGAKPETESKSKNVVMPGSSVSVAKHAVTGMTSASGKKASTKEVVPLLLESDLGRILVMPIIPSAPAVSASRGELAAMDDSHDESTSFADHQKPFMLLTLNAPSDGPSNKTSSTPNASANSNTMSPALASSTATLSANNAGRSRLRSGGNTPTSIRSDTPSRSPTSDTFPTSVTMGGPQSSSFSPSGAEAEVAASATSSAEEDAREAKAWSALYARAKALARVLAPSLTKCGVGQHHIDEHHDGRGSGMVSDDDAEA
ncbi:hypothetical protein PSEUBRA_006308 [Kalmanozyma brasiliensis GHG001]|uniref:uncharacterized protein n=1 Tax=Kalmanozyma brasiliensis (strain GHG001) TaxID=1365824 RepID=UPI002867D073|nr:uncharacterized protein PSEUBRA_006308 [Kalmanozyma brasiliensis GHG001]KAF6767657.1 hypothetical protein PSEUBRA_006308 [Kalmanozyma brasiliensis GHG001]